MCLQRQHWKTFHEKGISELSFEEIKNIILNASTFMTQMGFCGGEIFLRKDIMDILSFAAERNSVQFVTNGTLVTSEMARDFVNMKIRSILISIDGTKQIHDDIRGQSDVFDHALQTIEYIVKWKKDIKSTIPDIAVNSVVMDNNLSSLSELVKMISRLEIKNLGLQMIDKSQCRFSPMKSLSEAFIPPSTVDSYPSSNIEEELIILKRNAHEAGVNIQIKPEVTLSEFSDYYSNKMDLSSFYCIHPWSQTIISPYGDVYPCYMLSMGNVREESLLKIWNGNKYRDFRTSLKKHRLFPQCLGCCFMTRKRWL
jgi:MoaA/NifB/PqqE/SkfB family radical SAM enzyme